MARLLLAVLLIAAWHLPMTNHAATVQKTFFVIGGSNGNVSERGDQPVHLVGYFDHRTGEVSRPVRLLNKQTEDAHDNPRAVDRRRGLPVGVLGGFMPGPVSGHYATRDGDVFVLSVRMDSERTRPVPVGGR